MTKLGPRLIEKLHKAAKAYGEWKKNHRPEWKPWREIDNENNNTNNNNTNNNKGVKVDENEKVVVIDKVEN